jgi:RNA polymerase sigma factor (TIGR02999 family)
MVKPPVNAQGAGDTGAGDGAPAGVRWTGRAHFFAVAAKAMRQVLANHARDRRRDKRGGGWHRVTLNERLTSSSERDLDLLALDEALEALAKLDERQSKIVELRFFAEMNMNEIAQVMDISLSTAEREWRMARAWLSARLSDADGTGSS